MGIDYSKWDNLEVSDDSDIEVHPNVDKKSFIKWKQRDIHEKRQQRNVEIKSIIVQLTMYRKLNERVDFLLGEFSDDDDICSLEKVMGKLNGKFDTREKFDYEALLKEKGDSIRKGLHDLHFEPSEIENTPPYNEMVDDLFIQIKEDNPETAKNGSKLKELLKEHRVKIDDILSKQTIKLDDLLKQKSMLISSDDYHTGFDSSFINREKEEKEQQEKQQKETQITQQQPPKKDSVTSMETLNTPKAQEAKSDAEVLGELTVLPATTEFAKIPITDLSQSAQFLIKNQHICSEQQKDALIMTSFDHQLKGDTATAKQIIHQSLLLQYTAQLAGPHPNKDQFINTIKLFFSKIGDKSSPANRGFQEDVSNTLKHIITRCEVLKQEHGLGGDDDDNGEEALIQLRALDDDTQLSVNLPQEGTPEYTTFTSKLPQKMQEAVKTQSLDEVNKVFASYKIEEAEKILETINECGVIGVSGYLEDEKDFNELQKQYNEQSIEEQGEVEGEGNDSDSDSSVVKKPVNAANVDAANFDTTDVVD